MNMNIFVVLDKAVGAYERPQFFRSDAEAMRAFVTAVEKPDSPFHLHPEDYSFFRVGTYDDQTGELRPEEPKCHARAIDVVMSKEKDNG